MAANMTEEHKQQDDEEEEGVFEITDFTNATPWESFVSAIEDLLHQWGLTASTYSSDSGYYPQHHKSEKLSYIGHTFVVTLVVSGEKKRPTPKQSDQDWPDALVYMMDQSNDFPPKAHHISRWYGINQFILMTPDERSPAITSEAQTKLLLSSISLAITNTGCVFPIFVQIQRQWRHMYIGQCEGCGLRTTFEMIHLQRIPSHFNHLSGLLDLFRSKLHNSSTTSNIVTIAARFTYTLRHWSIDDWPIEQLGDIDGKLVESNLVALPVGATSDPIQELHLSAVWPYLSEETVIDNGISSGFNPFNAPTWSIKTHLLANPGLLLNERLNTFLKVCYRHETIPNLLGNKLLHEDIYNPGVGSSDYSHALTKLTSPSSISSPISLSSVVYSTSQKLELGSEFEPISEKEVDSVLQYAFPDSFPDYAQKRKEDSYSTIDDKLTYLLKSAPLNSLTGRLARILCIVNFNYGLKAFAHVWYEVVQELRYRWENGITISGLGDQPPDMLCCLMHQKFQMLNNCIRHKITHTQKLYSASNRSQSETRNSSQDSEFQSPTSSLSFSQRVSRQVSQEDSIPNVLRTSNSSDDEFYEAQEALDSDSNSHSKTENESGKTPVKNDLRTDNLFEETNHSESPRIASKKLLLEPVSIDPLSLFANEDEIGPPPIHQEIQVGRIGALEPYKNLLLIVTGEPLYVPETQESTPLTEDMLWEQQDVLSRLGTTQEAAHVRAKMQSMSLISDMEAFKAANPGCLLDDFVRWYSPRDWIEGEEEETTMSKIESSTDGWDIEDDWDIETNDRCVKGHLSVRMKQPGNVWVESWENAKPIPAYKQKRLFDDTKEAEKVLHFLSALKPSEIVLMLFPCLLHSAIDVLQQRLETTKLPTAQVYVQDVINVANTIQRLTLDSLPVLQECIGLLEKAEHDISTANSLHMKLCQGLELKGSDNKTQAEVKELDTSVQMILEEPELVLQEPTTSITGLSLQGLLTAQLALQNLDRSSTHSAAQELPKPAAREFILRTVSSQPSVCSSPSPQRMFCLLTKEEMRLAGAFTQDILIA